MAPAAAALQQLHKMNNEVCGLIAFLHIMLLS
jgi:hypothetical protein